MNNLLMYCLSLNNEDFDKIKSLDYIPVGLGPKKFSKGWLRDDTGKNISNKNSFYGEYSFHYWFWKNKLDEINQNNWIGFCAYRRFWTKNEDTFHIINKNDFLNKAQNEWNNYDVILGQNIYMDGWSKMKIIKHGLRSFILNPKYLLKKNQNLKLHFDSFHGYGNLDKAIEVLNVNDKEDLIIAKNKEICDIKNILALKEGKDYKDVSELRYGRIMLMTDSDVDGSHIKGLVINFLSKWNSLMRLDGFVTSLLTPIVKVWKKGAKNG